MEKVYLAGAWGRREEIREYAEELKGEGHEVTSRWLWQHDGTVPYAQAAEEDLLDVHRASVLVLFSGDRPGSRGGRHVEFGFALAKGRWIIVVGDGDDGNIFYELPWIVKVADWGSAKEILRRGYVWRPEVPQAPS